MKPRFVWPVILLAVGMALIDADAATLNGRYVATEPDPVTMTLRESKGGVVTGSLTQEGQSVPITGKRRGDKITGRVGGGDAMLPFTAVVKGQHLTMELGPADDAAQIVFRRAGTTAAAVEATAMPGQSTPSQATPNHRHVSINDTRLSDAELTRIEQAYRVRIADADYWYDNVLGAWGMKGGPAQGFISPGLNLGGPLRPDASAGNTQIFVNGRELHRIDVLALQQITGPIYPGRYFITSQGIAGYEGGPPMWNLLAMSTQRSGGSGGSGGGDGNGGGDNIWSTLTGAAGNSQGGCSYVNLGGGNITSSGCD